MSGEKAGERDRTFLLPDDCDCLPPYADCTHGPAEVEGECGSCGESPEDECPKSKRPCGHHCNHVWTHDACDWCGKEFAPTPVPSEVAETTAGEREAEACTCGPFQPPHDINCSFSSYRQEDSPIITGPESKRDPLAWADQRGRSFGTIPAEPDAGEVDTALIVTSLVAGRVSGPEAIAALDRQIAALLDRVRREEGAKALREAAADLSPAQECVDEWLRDRADRIDPA